MTPALLIQLDLEGHVVVMPVCERESEEARLAFDLAQRDLRLDERVRLWAETTRERASATHGRGGT